MRVRDLQQILGKFTDGEKGTNISDCPIYIETKDGFAIDQEEIKEFVKAELRSSRVPQLMVVWDELPYNETGKLLRRVVREELSK